MVKVMFRSSELAALEVLSDRRGYCDIRIGLNKLIAHGPDSTVVERFDARDRIGYWERERADAQAGIDRVRAQAAARSQADAEFFAEYERMYG